MDFKPVSSGPTDVKSLESSLPARSRVYLKKDRVIGIKYYCSADNLWNRIREAIGRFFEYGVIYDKEKIRKAMTGKQINWLEPAARKDIQKLFEHVYGKEKNHGRVNFLTQLSVLCTREGLTKDEMLAMCELFVQEIKLMPSNVVVRTALQNYMIQGLKHLKQEEMDEELIHKMMEYDQSDTLHLIVETLIEKEKYPLALEQIKCNPTLLSMLNLKLLARLAPIADEMLLKSWIEKKPEILEHLSAQSFTLNIVEFVLKKDGISKEIIQKCLRKLNACDAVTKENIFSLVFKKYPSFVEDFPKDFLANRADLIQKWLEEDLSRLIQEKPDIDVLSSPEYVERLLRINPGSLQHFSQEMFSKYPDIIIETLIKNPNLFGKVAELLTDKCLDRLQRLILEKKVPDNQADAILIEYYTHLKDDFIKRIKDGELFFALSCDFLKWHHGEATTDVISIAAEEKGSKVLDYLIDIGYSRLRTVNGGVDYRFKKEHMNKAIRSDLRSVKDERQTMRFLYRASFPDLLEWMKEDKEGEPLIHFLKERHPEILKKIYSEDALDLDQVKQLEEIQDSKGRPVEFLKLILRSGKDQNLKIKWLNAVSFPDLLEWMKEDKEGKPLIHVLKERHPEILKKIYGECAPGQVKQLEEIQDSKGRPVEFLKSIVFWTFSPAWLEKPKLDRVAIPRISRPEYDTRAATLSKDMLALFDALKFGKKEGDINPALLGAYNAEEVRSALNVMCEKIMCQEAWLGTPKREDQEGLHAFYTQMLVNAEHVTTILKESKDPEQVLITLLGIAKAKLEGRCAAAYQGEIDQAVEILSIQHRHGEEGQDQLEKYVSHHIARTLQRVVEEEVRRKYESDVHTLAQLSYACGLVAVKDPLSTFDPQFLLNKMLKEFSPEKFFLICLESFRDFPSVVLIDYLKESTPLTYNPEMAKLEQEAERVEQELVDRAKELLLRDLSAFKFSDSQQDSFCTFFLSAEGSRCSEFLASTTTLEVKAENKGVDIEECINEEELRGIFKEELQEITTKYEEATAAEIKEYIDEHKLQEILKTYESAEAAEIKKLVHKGEFEEILTKYGETKTNAIKQCFKDQDKVREIIKKYRGQKVAARLMFTKEISSIIQKNKVKIRLNKIMGGKIDPATLSKLMEAQKAMSEGLSKWMREDVSFDAMFIRDPDDPDVPVDGSEKEDMIARYLTQFGSPFKMIRNTRSLEFANSCMEGGRFLNREGVEFVFRKIGVI